MSDIEASQAAVEPWVDAKAVAKHLGYDSRYICVLAKQGKLPGRAMPNGARFHWRFKISQVDAAMNQLCNQSRIA